MKVVIAANIQKKEFRRGQIPKEDLAIILHGYAKGIFTLIKGESLPKGSRLIKLYVTTVGGAKRIVFLVDVQTNTGFFLFYRGKNDEVGKNISIKNPIFKKLLLHYLDLLQKDILEERFTSYETE